MPRYLVIQKILVQRTFHVDADDETDAKKRAYREPKFDEIELHVAEEIVVQE
jgi:hypothetical protein